MALCECGCGLTAQPDRRFIWGHNAALRVYPSLVERFWSKVAIAGPDECWLWLATRSKQGYGYIDSRRAHRVAWELTHGPIPVGSGYHGTCVLHRCDVRACVNPAHLFLGSNQDNMTDMKNKHRISGERSWKARLTTADVAAIRQSNERPIDLASRYGVKPCTISNIRAGRIWKESHVA